MRATLRRLGAVLSGKEKPLGRRFEATGGDFEYDPGRQALRVRPRVTALQKLENAGRALRRWAPSEELGAADEERAADGSDTSVSLMAEELPSWMEEGVKIPAKERGRLYHDVLKRAGRILE